MENLNGNNGCVIIKKKEYEELLKLRETVKEISKPDHIDINFCYADYYFNRNRYCIPNVESTINLSDSIRKQVSNIAKTFRDGYESWHDARSEGINARAYENAKYELYCDLSKMNYFQFKRWIKENK